MTIYELFLISVQGQLNIRSIMAYGHIVLTTCILFQYFDVQAVVVKPSVFVRSGSTAELTCTFDTHASEGFTLEWRYAASGTPAIQAKTVLYYNENLYWVNSREGRMALVQNPPVSGVASVRIIKAEISDTGLYICVVTNPNDWSGSGQGLISFTVLDQHTGSLMLHSLSDAFAGTYTCKASNELGQAECSVTLIMTDAPDIGGVFTGISLIVLLTVIYIIHLSLGKGRSTSRKHAEEAGEKQFSTSSAEGKKPTTLSVQY